MPKTQDTPVDVARLKLLDELAAVLAETTEQVRDDLRSVWRLAGQVGKSALDATRQVPLAHTQCNRLLLPSLGERGLKGSAQEVGQNSFGYIVDLAEGDLGSLERRETDELNRLSEFVEILNRLLHFVQATADRVGGQNDFENRITDGTLVENWSKLATALVYEGARGGWRNRGELLRDMCLRLR